MTTIHHATAKKAAHLNVKLVHVAASDTWAATAPGHPPPQTQYGKTAKDALDLMVLELKAKKALKLAANDKVAKPEKKPRAKKVKKELTDEEKAAKPLNRSVVAKGAKELYAKLGGNSGSNIAKALSDAYLGGGPGTLRNIAKENGIPFVWQHLNVGQQRMCLGTVLKGKDNRNEPVLIEGKKYTN